MQSASMVSKPTRSWPRLSLPYLGFAVLVVGSLVLRWSLYSVTTSDYRAFVSPWYDFIQSNGGFAALRYDFSNYNPPYLYLIAVLTYLPIPKLIALKSLSVAFDLVLAAFGFLLLRLKYRESFVPLIGALVLLFTPTVFINSAAWGQCDAIYASFCLGSLYFLLKKQWGWACALFGLAIAFKLQAIFFLPVLLIFAFKRTLPLRYLPIIPAVFVLMLAPAFVAGRDARSLLTVYAEQADNGGIGVGGGGGARGQFGQGGANPATGGASGTRPQFNRANRPPTNANGTQAPATDANGTQAPTTDGSRGAGRGPTRAADTYTALTYNAPTIYKWFDGTFLGYNKYVGIGLAALAVALMGGLLLLSKASVGTDIILHVTMLCVMTVPFFLPEMHERYFFLADVLAIIYAFYFPRMFIVPIIMQLASLLSYGPYFLDWEPIKLKYVAIGIFGIMLYVAYRYVGTLRAGGWRSLPFLGRSALPS